MWKCLFKVIKHYNDCLRKTRVFVASAVAVAVAVAAAVAITVAITHRSYVCVTNTNVFGLAFALLASKLRAYNSTTLAILNTKIQTCSMNSLINGFICNSS